MQTAEVFYWLKGELFQNFGDYLSEFFLEELFYPLGKRAHRIHLIGSVIDAAYIPRHENNPAPDGHIQPEDQVFFWGCGVRAAGGLTKEEWQRTQVLSVRGPLSASELGVAVPQGDPALLLPALYQPVPMSEITGKSLCIPHFLDDRSDAELLEISGCDILMRPNILADRQDVRRFIDTIAEAGFVLSAALHGAIVAAAYNRPFGFWDNGRIDVPFKWADFAASIGIPAIFHMHRDAAISHYEAVIKSHLSLPTLLDSIAVAPLLPRPEALLKILRYELARVQPEKILAELDHYVSKFDLQRLHFDGAVNDFITLHRAALETADLKANDALAVAEHLRYEITEARAAQELALQDAKEARAAEEHARHEATEARAAQELALRDAKEARAAEEHARHEATEARAAQELALRDAKEARAAKEQARSESIQAENIIEAIRHSSSWRITKPLRALGYIAQRHWGLALLEIGVPLRHVKRLAARRK